MDCLLIGLKRIFAKSGNEMLIATFVIGRETGSRMDKQERSVFAYGPKIETEFLDREIAASLLDHLHNNPQSLESLSFERPIKCQLSYGKGFDGKARVETLKVVGNPNGK